MAKIFVRRWPDGSAGTAPTPQLTQRGATERLRPGYMAQPGSTVRHRTFDVLA